MNVRTLRLAAASATAVITATVALTACGPKAGDTGQFAQDKQLLTTCPKDKKVGAKVDVDVSGSGRSAQLGADRTNVVETVARRTAVCGGHLRVSAFSVTTAATVILYDHEISLSGATDNARLRHVQTAVDDVLQKVKDAYPASLKALSPNGSDILGQYRLAAEYLGQLKSGYRLELVIVSDGYQAGQNISLGGKVLSQAEANAIAARITVPSLPGSSVTVAGIGKVATGKPADSAIVDGVVRFWNAVCHRSKAEQCSSVTDYTTTGR
ncbi:hypothetical protein ACFCV3_00970 [Kribbella sp. NPDC056345]|uniref:hypothetical protein n=1 Tax=Kribbella sp. NPDC056345 TaxID=3345789 RepID=UPI0035D66EC7